MFYITKKETETGKNFAKLLKRRKVAIAKQKELAKKYGFGTYRSAYWQVWGGFSSCLDFKETPDKSIWGKGAEKNEFYPKKNCKEGKELWNEFNNMPCVSREELNECIGYNSKGFSKIGFASSNKIYFGFETDKKWGVKVPEDCEEVTQTKYDELFK